MRLRSGLATATDRMLSAVRAALLGILGSVPALQSAAGSGRLLELFILTGIAIRLQYQTAGAIGAEQQSVPHVMRALERVRPDVSCLEHWQRVFAGDGA